MKELLKNKKRLFIGLAILALVIVFAVVRVNNKPSENTQDSVTEEGRTRSGIKVRRFEGTMIKADQRSLSIQTEEKEQVINITPKVNLFELKPDTQEEVMQEMNLVAVRYNSDNTVVAVSRFVMNDPRLELRNNVVSRNRAAKSGLDENAVYVNGAYSPESLDVLGTLMEIEASEFKVRHTKGDKILKAGPGVLYQTAQAVNIDVLTPEKPVIVYARESNIGWQALLIIVN